MSQREDMNSMYGHYDEENFGYEHNGYENHNNSCHRNNSCCFYLRFPHCCPRPRCPEPRCPEPRCPEPRCPEPRCTEPRCPEPRCPEPHCPEPRCPERCCPERCCPERCCPEQRCCPEKRCHRCNCKKQKLAGLQVQNQPETVLTLGNNLPMPFNTVITDEIDYVTFTAPSTFTITRRGNYYVAWQINTDGSTQATLPAMSLVFSDGQTIVTTSSINAGQISATAFVHISDAPTTFQLVNTTGNDILFSALSETANLTIIHLEKLPFHSYHEEFLTEEDDDLEDMD